MEREKGGREGGRSHIQKQNGPIESDQQEKQWLRNITKTVHQPQYQQIQIKTTLRFYFIPVRMATINGKGDNNLGENAGKMELLFTVGGLQTHAATVETSVKNSQKAKIKSVI